MKKQKAVSSRQKNLLLVLPLLTLPFITMAFWVLTKDSHRKSKLADEQNSKGLNMKMPEADISGKLLDDKMKLYELAYSDSLQLKQWQRNDPYFNSTSNSGKDTYETDIAGNAAMPPPNDLKQNERKIEEQVARITKLIDESAERKPGISNPANLAEGNDEQSAASMTLKLATARMDDLKKETRPSSELLKLDSMLDKILLLQQDNTADVDKGKLSKIEIDNEYDSIQPETASVGILQPDSLLTDTNSIYSPGFSGIEVSMTGPEKTTVSAMIQSTVKLSGAAVISFQLLEPLTCNGMMIDAGTVVSGIAQISAERILVPIRSVVIDGQILPVQIDVYDLDGIEGVKFTTSDKDNSTSKTTQRLIEGWNIPAKGSLEMKAAEIGVEAARNILFKNTKQRTLTVPAGYRVLLAINTKQNSIR